MATGSKLAALGLLLLSKGVLSQFAFPLQHQETLCAQYENFNTSNDLYTVSTNGWGADGSGGQCITVGDNSDSKNNATAWSATWGWGNNPDLVHAFPNMNYESTVLPLKVQNLSSLSIDVEWSYEGGSTSTGNSDFAALATLAAKADVAVDMFFDADPTIAMSTTAPQFEVMVWLGSFGNATPIGYVNGTRQTTTIGSSVFDLYIGSNGAGQTVFSWLATSNQTSFSGDISPLVRAVANHSGPIDSDYLGVYQFGTEQFHTDDGANVTFTAKSVAMGIVEGAGVVTKKSAAAGHAANSVLLVVFAGLAAFLVIW